MSDAYPISATALLKDANGINTHTFALLSAIEAGLTARGITENQFMIAADILDYFWNLNVTPTRPESALSIFVGIEGEAALNQIVTKRSNDGLN